jgi:8-oxo-dGTP diphosphatase
MPGPRLAVGAIAVRGDALLLVRRAKDPGRDLWSLPGGSVRLGERIEEAVAREVLEETGVEARVSHLVGIFEVMGDPHYVVLDFFVDVSGDSEPRAGGDAGEARWVPFDEITHLHCTPRFHETLRGWGVLPSADEQRD